jgi:hypothetical protein
MGLSHWPGSCYDSEIDDFCIAFLEEAHRSPSRSVAYLNGARLGQSLECGRRVGKIAYCVEHTPATANVPEGFTFGAWSRSNKTGPCKSGRNVPCWN